MFATDARAQRGFSIVEVMVAIVISMLVAIAATSTATTFTAMQRQAVGAAAVSSEAATALSAIKQDVIQAGLGFFGDSDYLCSSLNYRINTTDVALGANPFTPLRLRREANNSDSLEVAYASDVTGGANVPLAASSDLSAAVLESFLPAAVGQLILLAPPTPGVPCTVRTVTAVTAATGTIPQTISFAETATANRGPAFLSPLAYPPKSRAVLLGALEWRRYSLNSSGELVMERRTAAGTTSTVLLGNVVSMRAQIGIASGSPASFAGWKLVTDVPSSSPASTWGALGANEIRQARAVRLQVVTRSRNPERVRTGMQCTASALPLPVIGGTVMPAAPASPSANVAAAPAACYRYRTNEVVIPLRNWIVGLRPAP